MKRFNCFVAISLSIAMMSAAGGSALAVENTADNSKYTINIPYEYPLQPGTDEWFAIESHSEKAEMCQIPDDILENLSTAALVETVVNYPYFTDMSAFSTPELGYATVRDHFNGLQELEKRADGASTLLSYYQALKNQRADVNFLTFASMEITLQQPEITLQMARSAPNGTTLPSDALRILYPDAAVIASLTYPTTPSGN